MAYQYLGAFAKLISPYGDGNLLLNIIDCRHGEIKADIGTITPFSTDFYYQKGFSDISAVFPSALRARIDAYATRLVIDSEDIVWLIVDDSLVERPYVKPGVSIKVGYTDAIFGAQATMKPDNSRDFGPDVIHGIPATLDTLIQRGLF